MTRIKRGWLVRILVGGGLGAAGYLLLSFLTQPGVWGFGNTSWEFAFTFCYDSRVPEALGAVLGLVLWFAFGAEIAVATLEFADEGRSLARRSALHFLCMALTLSAWVLLNFGGRELPTFLLPFALVYVLIWLGRWVGWYAELAAIRARLGLTPEASPLKWRETLPYVPFALLLCFLLPAVLWRVLGAFLGSLAICYLLLPVCGFTSALSLGKRHGFCPLYPILCGLFLLPVVQGIYNIAPSSCLIPAVSALLGNGLGAAYRRWHTAETLSAD